MKVAPATPAVARLWIVEVPILAWLSMGAGGELALATRSHVVLTNRFSA